MNLASDSSAQRFDRFQIIRNFRKGGMGVVSLAFDPSLKKIVILKRLPDSANEEVAARFSDEIRVSRSLDHPSLARALDARDEAPTPFLVLERFDGQDLDALMERARRLGKRPSAATLAAIGSALCSALATAHRLPGFVHRDVTPANVILGYDGRVHLIDFGLALTEGRRAKTQVGAAVGTLGFIAPEQRRGDAEPRSDLYSVGMLLWFLCTGAPLPQPEAELPTFDAFRAKVVEWKFELPEKLARVVWRALRTEPRDRFDDATTMEKAIREAVSDQLATVAELATYVRTLFPGEIARSSQEMAALEQQFEIAAAKEPSEQTLLVDGYAPIKKPESRGRWLAFSAMVVACGGLFVLLVLHITKPDPPIMFSPPPSVPAVAPSPPAEPTPPAPLPPAEPTPVAATPASAPTPTAKPSATPKSTTPTAKPAAATPTPHPTPTPAAEKPGRAKLKAALALIEAGQNNNARVALSELIDDPDVRPDALAAMAHVERRGGNYAEAGRYADKALDAGAKSRVALLLIRGDAALRRGDAPGAERDFTKALSTDPSNDEARIGLERARAQSHPKTP